MKKFKIVSLIALALVLVFAMTACSDDTANDQPTSSTTEAVTTSAEATTAVDTTAATSSEATDEELEGSVIVDGSGTVYPLMANIAEEYMVNEQNGVSVQVGRAGSSAGFKKFVVGETNLSDASRPMKDSEKESFVENGFQESDVMEVKLAYDGLTMVINKENDWAKEMTRQEIIDMYVSGKYNADDMVKWSDIRADWPAEEIKFYGPNENHGTYEFFYENILEEQDMVKTASLQQEYSTLVDLVSKEKNAIAFFGFGYYVSNQDKLQAVAVDFGEGPVEPTLDTIGEDSAYSGFTRPVFTYVNLVHAAEKPEVLDFAMYVVSEDGAKRLAGDNGFAPLSDDVYQGYMSQLEALK